VIGDRGRQRNPASDPAYLWGMKTHTTPGTSGSRRSRGGGLALWIPLLTGLLLMLLAAASRAETGIQAKRTEQFNATLSSSSTLRIENVSGDIVAKPGRELSATVAIAVTAPTQARAAELLRATIIQQTRDEEEYVLRTLWPLSDHRGSSRRRILVDGSSHPGRRGELRCEDCKVTAQYDVTVPPGVHAILHTVNGEVRTDGLDDDLELQTVNGGVAVRAARKSVSAHSVNGKVDVASLALPPAAILDLKTVNGGVLLTLPKDAKFNLSASSMNGAIASTFPLPARVEPEPEEPSAARPPAAPAPPAPPRAARTPRRVVVEKDDEDNVVVDLRELEKELEESMREVDVEVRESLRGMDRQMRHLKIFSRNDYTGSVGGGGAQVRLSTLNGPITVLASGTKESEAKMLVSPRRNFSVEVPRVEVHVPRVQVRVPPVEVHPPRPMVRVDPELAGDEEVVRGDISGDFLATAGGGTYRIGNVSGRVKILSHSGEIHVASAGSGADLKTHGGDITIGTVRGDLKAQTLAGDVRAGTVSGSATIETSGGDVRIERIGGSADVRTGGGDVVLRGVVGGGRAETEGGDVHISLVSREPRGGLMIRNAGGDVTLTVPSDLRAEVELDVSDCGDPGETCIRSDFSEVAVLRRSESARATGTLNGGGPRVVVRTTSGTIRLQKGSASGN